MWIGQVAEPEIVMVPASMEPTARWLAANRVWTVPLLAGLASGVTVAGLFNPWDRALYLSVKDRTPFIHRGNWLQPFQGFTSAVVQRTLSGSSWFILNDWILAQLVARRLELDLATQSREVRRTVTSQAMPLEIFAAANLAGAGNGAILNSISVVKYHNWGKENPDNFFRTARAMVRARGGSLRPLFRGLGTTVLRDIMFGGIFASLRLVLSAPVDDLLRPLGAGSATSFVSSMVAAATATLASAPLNFVRNMKYAARFDRRSPTIAAVLTSLAREMAASPTPLRFMLDRFRVGWGTARVAIGMAVGWELYELAKASLDCVLDAAEDSDCGDV